MDAAAEPYDLAIIGAGIVGASVACHCAPRARVLLLEAESAPGCHSTGRSAALYTEAYGPPAVRALTRASRAFFDTPPEGFAAVPLLRPRGTLFVGGEEQRRSAHAQCGTLRAEGSSARLIDGRAARELVPVLRPEASAVALHDPAAFDIDVDALLQGCLRRARAHGATLVPGARVAALARGGGGADGSAGAGGWWQLTTADGRRHAARTLVNAAGAWADAVAALAGAQRIGLEPRRRSAFLFEPPPGVGVAGWPAVIALDESWYFKPDAGGLLLGSPANADPTHAHDVVAEELDVALGIHRIEAATTMTIRRPRSTWAGLRSFVADGEPVIGFDPLVPDFFWAAALGGYGIQSSPGVGALAAAWLMGEPAPAQLALQARDEELRRRLAPGRPQTSRQSSAP